MIRILIFFDVFSEIKILFIFGLFRELLSLISYSNLKIKVSSVLRGFVDQMLVRRPEHRTSAGALLRHPFIKLARDPKCLLPLITKPR